MTAIRLSHGVMFVNCEGITVKVSAGGECSLASISYEVLEWDLRTEPPDRWEYVSENEIREMNNGVYEGIIAVVDRVKKIIG